MFKHLNTFRFVILALLIFSCSSNPYKKTNKVYEKKAKVYAKQLRKIPENNITDSLNYGKYAVGTTNFNLRKPNYVVIHHTAQDSVGQTLKTFTLERTQVSAHYVIDDNGEVYHMLNDFYRAWHGGIGKWGNNTDLNSSSIGIELDNNGSEEFSFAQINSLLKLLNVLKEKYKIPAQNFIGHSDIAPSRKVDPNENFPWSELAEEGYGLWFDQEEVEQLQLESEIKQSLPQDSVAQENNNLNQNESLLKSANIIPANFDASLALKIIGYDISDLDSAIKAFKLHFIQEDYKNPVLRENDLKVLFNLYQKYL